MNFKIIRNSQGYLENIIGKPKPYKLTFDRAMGVFIVLATMYFTVHIIWWFIKSLNF